jgi:hypothetical protein
MMGKGIGFNRNIKLAWLDAAAAFCAEMDEATAVRGRLLPIIQSEISAENSRKIIDILLNIWFKSKEERPALWQQAIQIFQETTALSDRVWLHYGLTITAYPFFWQAVTIIGQQSRYAETITTAAVRQALYAELGELGSVEAATSRVIFSLRDWGILATGDQRNEYRPQYRVLATERPLLEQWLLSCALHAHAAEQISVTDLLHLPALFPFNFTVSAADLRQAAGFEVQRQGMGLDMVRLSAESNFTG